MTTSRRIGLVDLETSHPAAFVPILRDLGHEVTTVLDSNAMRGSGYAAQFAVQHDIPVVAQDERELAAACDVALLLGTDWDRHVEQIRLLREDRVAVLVDKPVAGRVGDLRSIGALTDGPRVTGGSSLRTADEVREWRTQGHTAVSVRSSCSGPPLFYGVHAVSLAVGLLGEGLVAARALPSEGGLAGEIRHVSGTTIRIDVPRLPPGSPYRAEITRTTGEVDVVKPDAAGLYRPFLATCLDYLVGRGPAPAAPLGLVEPELALLAMAWSAQHSDRWVQLDETPDDWHPWAGAPFAEEYRASLPASWST